MKKYLLTALLGVFAFVGFTNAESYTFVGTLQDVDGVYSPNSITFDNDITISKSNVDYVCNVNGDDIYSCKIIFGDISNSDCIIDYYDGDDLYIMGTDGNEYCELTAGTYNVNGYGNPFSSFTISSSSVGGDSGGSSSDSSSNTPLLSGGISQLTPVVTGIKGVVVEFIPYVVYISIGILLATLGFIVIKRLMNWMTVKIKGTFSSRRRK